MLFPTLVPRGTAPTFMQTREGAGSSLQHPAKAGRRQQACSPTSGVAFSPVTRRGESSQRGGKTGHHEGYREMALVNRFVREEAGQDLIEYALLAGFISLAAVAAITAIGTALNTLYTNVHDQVVAAN